MNRALIIFISFCAFAQAEPLAERVSQLNLPGRGQYGECVAFADALTNWLHSHGQSSRVIYYTYRNGLLHRPVAHAIVAWQREGTWWAMGNELMEPRSLGTNEDGESIDLAQRYDGRATSAVLGKQQSAADLVIQSAPSEVHQSQIIAVAGATEKVSTPRAPRMAQPASQSRIYQDKNGTQFLVTN
jgi:hypothetical protein